jgi:hypothetical protein
MTHAREPAFHPRREPADTLWQRLLERMHSLVALR